MGNKTTLQKGVKSFKRLKILMMMRLINQYRRSMLKSTFLAEIALFKMAHLSITTYQYSKLLNLL